MPDAFTHLQDVLRSRETERPEGSYSTTLFEDRERLQRKIMEEAFEVCLELGRAAPDRQRVTEEAADLVYHLMVGLVAHDVGLEDVARTLEARQR